MKRNTSVYMFYLIINCKPSFHRIFITDTIIPFKIQAYHHLLDNFSQYRRWKTTYIKFNTKYFCENEPKKMRMSSTFKIRNRYLFLLPTYAILRERGLHTSSKPENKVKNDDDDYEILLQTFYILPVLLLLSNGTNNNNNIYPYLLFANKAHTQV